MLIVCPNCATSYMIDPASVGPAGRAVRCARCKSTWFAGAPQTAPNPAPQTEPSVSAFVNGVIAEAEAETGRAAPDSVAFGQNQPPPPPDVGNAAPAGDEFGAEPTDRFPTRPWLGAEPAPFDDASHNTELAPRDDVHIADHDAMPVTDAPSLVPPIGHDAVFDGGHHELDAEEVESFAARRERMKARQKKTKRTSRWTAVVLVLFAFNIALIGARSEVVRYLPQTASLFAALGLPVNLRHLKFDKVRITKETSDGVNILIIEGRIENTANKPIEVPRLRFAARNATGQDVYTWSAQPGRSILGPKESMEFHSRLAAPPSDATDVMVRFFTAQDAATGLSGGRK
jgi:predicted Zn finger-like uncharacterized protein